MSEVINIVVALAVIVFVFRWATTSSETPAERNTRVALGFKPKKVTPEMLITVQTMFPDIPQDNIRYDLLRTGNVEITTNKIIEKGFLDPPPAGYFRVYPRNGEQSQSQSNSNASNSRAGSSSASNPKQPSLIARYNLESRLKDNSATVNETPEEAGGKAAWEPTPEQREASLKERKAQMVLAARKRLIEQQKAAEKST